MSPVQETAKVATSFIDAFRNEPLSLALVAMNICLMGFFYFLLTTVSNQREREIGLLYADKKEVRELLARCVVPDRTSISRPPFKPLVKSSEPFNIQGSTKE
jgi:hypothetical protein